MSSHLLSPSVTTTGDAPKLFASKLTTPVPAPSSSTDFPTASKPPASAPLLQASSRCAQSSREPSHSRCPLISSLYRRHRTATGFPMGACGRRGMGGAVRRAGKGGVSSKTYWYASVHALACVYCRRLGLYWSVCFCRAVPRRFRTNSTSRWTYIPVSVSS